MDLSGEWRLRDVQGEYDLAMQLPGDGITALHRAGVIPDPYFGRNEFDLRWIAERDWVVSRSFVHAAGPADLVLDGLDTVADVILNGTTVLQAANAHRRWRVPVDLHPGENHIEIVFRSSVQAAAAAQTTMPFHIPYQKVNGPIPHANMLRKPQCDFGWDWNIALAPFGLWGRVALEAAPAVGDIFVSQRHSVGVADVTVRVAGATGPVTATLCGQRTTAEAVAGEAALQVRIPDPDLWWPVGQGAQVLHDLVVTCGQTSVTRRIGLRDLALVSAPDAAGRSFGFAVNGRPVFARGANWIPADALHGRITRDGVRDLLQSAVDAHMNMIRVWGGGRYEPDWFYDLCDEMGLMVWQDFMFACHLYPSTPAFLAEVDAEVRDVVGRLNHHACLALWCGDNELIGALTWFEESRRDRDRYLVNYDRLNRCIEGALRAVLPVANWWPSSPSPGPMAFGDAWHDDSSGDMHVWSVWHEGRDFAHYRDVKPRFCSEFGFQSYPSMPVIAGFAETADWNIASPVMESHQKNPGGNARIAETMFRTFRFPNNFANFVYLSQVQQGIAIHTAVTAWRALKPHCMGALYWQLNDTWPVASWSGLDHGGGWKLLHHMAQRFFAPLTVVAVPEANGGVMLRVINDTPAPVRVTVVAHAADMSGATRALSEAVLDAPTDRAADALHIPAGALDAAEILSFVWVTEGGQGGGDIHAPRPWKAYDLRPARIECAITQDGATYLLTLATHALAPFVAVGADVPGRFSANAVTLFPGTPGQIRFTPATAAATPTFTLRDLHSATCAVPERT